MDHKIRLGDIIKSNQVIIKAGLLGSEYNLLMDIEVNADVSDKEWFLHDGTTEVIGVGKDEREAVLNYKEGIVRFEENPYGYVTFCSGFSNRHSQKLFNSINWSAYIKDFDRNHGRAPNSNDVGDWEATRERFDSPVQRPIYFPSGNVEIYKGVGDDRN